MLPLLSQCFWFPYGFVLLLPRSRCCSLIAQLVLYSARRCAVPASHPPSSPLPLAPSDTANSPLMTGIPYCFPSRTVSALLAVFAVVVVHDHDHVAVTRLPISCLILPSSRCTEYIMHSLRRERDERNGRVWAAIMGRSRRKAVSEERRKERGKCRFWQGWSRSARA